MKTKFLPALAGIFALSLGAISSSAQSAAPTPVVPPELARLLGPELQAIIASHRDEAKALLDQRNDLLQKLKAATPAQRDAIVADLRRIMQQHQADQRELAKQIRDAIKARRDAAKKS